MKDEAPLAISKLKAYDFKVGDHVELKRNSGKWSQGIITHIDNVAAKVEIPPQVPNGRYVDKTVPQLDLAYVLKFVSRPPPQDLQPGDHVEVKRSGGEWSQGTITEIKDDWAITKINGGVSKGVPKGRWASDLQFVSRPPPQQDLQPEGQHEEEEKDNQVGNLHGAGGPQAPLQTVPKFSDSAWDPDADPTGLFKGGGQPKPKAGGRQNPTAQIIQQDPIHHHGPEAPQEPEAVIKQNDVF